MINMFNLLFFTGTLIAHIVFEDGSVKSRAEGYLSSITNSIEIVLQHDVEVRIDLVSENDKERLQSLRNSPTSDHTEKDGLLAIETNADSSISKASHDHRYKIIPNHPRKSLDSSEFRSQRITEQNASSQVQGDGFRLACSVMLLEGNDEASGDGGRGQETSVLRIHTDSIDEHRFESAWLQASDKNPLELASQSNPNRIQVMPQNGVRCENDKLSSAAVAVSYKHWEDELNHGIKALKTSDNQGLRKKQTGVHIDHCVISPSLLHSNGFTANSDKENL